MFCYEACSLVRPALASPLPNGSCVATEPLFTPVRRVWTTKTPIFIEKGISRESKVNLRYLIINQPILTSPIEKSQTFWSRKDTLCR
jgi:hypothetical protein